MYKIFVIFEMSGANIGVKILIDDKIPFIKGVFEPFAEVEYLEGSLISPHEVKDADALIVRTRTVCNASLLEGSRVRHIATATIGYDHIDTEFCAAKGIGWSAAPGCNADSVTHYICSVLITLARKHGLTLEGMTLGVVGAGHVGGRVARAAGALGMKVLLNDPPRERAEGAGAFCSLADIIEKGDIITLHVPLVNGGADNTYHLFGEAAISSMKKNQLLVNASRGEVVDGRALKEALKRKSIAGAALDVWEGEPHIDGCLAQITDICTPHIAGYSADGKAGGSTAAVRWTAARLGLPLSGWEPQRIPTPEGGLEFTINASGRTAAAVIGEAVLRTYDVEKESHRLKEDIPGFERQRGSYPVRRDMQAYSVYLRGADAVTAARLSALGFKVITDEKDRHNMRDAEGI